MKRKFLAVSAVLFFSCFSGMRAHAFTLINEICKMCDPAVLKTISDPSEQAAAEECCKCHKPCVSVSGKLGSTIDPAFKQCIENNEKCPSSDNCLSAGPVGSSEYECCKAGIDATKEPDKWKCCVDNKGSIPPNGCTPETCPKCPEPPPPPKVDCSLIGDPKIQKCCTEVYDKYGKFLFLSIAIDKCVDDGDSNGCNEFVKALGDVSITDSIVCCQYINNSVCESGSCIQNCQKIINTCPGNPGGTGGTTGGTTTSAAAGACDVQCKDKDCSIAVDTGGQGVAWVVNYTPPPGIGTVASAVLKQVEGPTMTADDPAASGTNALSIKTITDPSSLPPFVIYTAKPSSLMGTYLPKFKVEVQLNDLADHELATLTCGNDSALEAKGSGGCGCYLGASPLEFGVNALLLSLFAAPFVFRRRIKRD